MLEVGPDCARCTLYFAVMFPLCLGARPVVAQNTTATTSADSLQEVIVSGVRRSEQLSVEIKRYAPSIQDSISAEDIAK